MPPQITCPHCGNTINMENRKEVDYDKILSALNTSPRTFSQLLNITDLPRKTLSIRLKNLCTSGTIIKDGGYRLSAQIAPDYFKTSIHRKKGNGNGKMNGSILRVGKNIQWIPIALIVCLVVVSFGSAAMFLVQPPAGPSPPRAVFTLSPSTNVVLGQYLTFDASHSYDTDGYVNNYRWDFGDSTTATGKTATHTYKQVGTYWVTLEVTDNQGYTHTSQGRRVYVTSASGAKVIKFSIAPNRDLPDGWEAEWIAGKPLTFDGSEFSEANGFLPSHLWDFGDGAVKTGAKVAHTYQAAGTYDVSLRVTDFSGNTHTVTEKVYIKDTPTTRIYIDIPSGYNVGDTITLNIMIADVAELYSWQTGMTFNPTVFQCIPTKVPDEQNPTSGQSTAFAEGGFLKQAGTTMWFVGELDNAAGTIVAHGCTLQNPATPVSGIGALATVTFKVIGEGNTDIHLNSVILLNEAMQEIPVYVVT